MHTLFCRCALPSLIPASILALVALCNSTRVQADDWPQFRGPEGHGHSAEQPAGGVERNPECRLEPTDRRARVVMPCHRGRQVWMTTAVVDQGSLRAVRLDAKTGQRSRDIEVFHKDDLGRSTPKTAMPRQRRSSKRAGSTFTSARMAPPAFERGRSAMAQSGADLRSPAWAGRFASHLADC